MSLCLATPVLAMTLAVQAFGLNWTHSVEKTEWQESWQISPAGLVLEQARIRGSGAGMEPPEGSVLQDGWWVYHSNLPAQPTLHLAVSDATGRGWQLCTGGTCSDLEDMLSVNGKKPRAIEVSTRASCKPLGRSPFSQ
jgi:hypothetical protein